MFQVLKIGISTVNYQKHPSHNYFVLNRTIEDALYLETLGKDYRVLKLEDLGQKKVLKNFCSWAGVVFNKSMLYSYLEWA